MNSFEVGQRVICVAVNGTWTHERAGYPTCSPRHGCEYTIRAVEMGLLNDGTEVVAIRVREIINPPMQYANGFAEVNFDARAFRPVIERKTSIEVFQRILLDPSQPVSPAPAKEPAI